MSDNITQFPVVPRPLPPKARVIPIRDASEVPDWQKQQDLTVTRRDLDHALRKAVVIADYHSELPWLVRFLEAEIAKIKDKLGETNGG